MNWVTSSNASTRVIQDTCYVCWRIFSDADQILDRGGDNKLLGHTTLCKRLIMKTNSKFKK